MMSTTGSPTRIHSHLFPRTSRSDATSKTVVQVGWEEACSQQVHESASSSSALRRSEARHVVDELPRLEPSFGIRLCLACPWLGRPTQLGGSPFELVPPFCGSFGKPQGKLQLFSGGGHALKTPSAIMQCIPGKIGFCVARIGYDSLSPNQINLMFLVSTDADPFQAMAAQDTIISCLPGSCGKATKACGSPNT